MSVISPMPEPCVEGHECGPCAVFHYVLFGILVVALLTGLYYLARRRLAERRERQIRELVSLRDRVHRR